MFSSIDFVISSNTVITAVFLLAFVFGILWRLIKS